MNKMTSSPSFDFGPHPLLTANDIDSNLAPQPHFLKSEAVRIQICMSDAGKLHQFPCNMSLMIVSWI